MSMAPLKAVTVSITIYEAKKLDYPESEEEWNCYDSILLPGSLSSAYETDEWIEKLKSVVRSEIHAKGRKTLGICFGHQIFAHSFSEGGGLCAKCPKGKQIGRREFEFSNNEWLKPANFSTQSMLYTHQDMVHSLPECAIALGGTETVPIQGAAYFTSEKSQADSQPYAFTFQGHPEFACDQGFKTFCNICAFNDENALIPSEVTTHARADATETFKSVEHDCVHLMQSVGRAFGWI